MEAAKSYETLTQMEYTNKYLLSYIRLLVTTGTEALRPKLDTNGNVHYNVGITELSYEKLLELYKSNILYIAGEESFPTCSKCGSLSLHVQLACPHCNEQYLRKSEVIKHFECGYIASVDEFTSNPHGLYMCPKCKKFLNRAGLDYGSVGINFICNTCNFIQSPSLNIVCDQGHLLRTSELDLKSFPVFKVNKVVSDYYYGYKVYEYPREYHLIS